MQKASKPPTHRTVRPPPISCGKRAKDILVYLAQNQGKHFSKRRYCIDKGISRSSLYTILRKLETHEFVYSYIGAVQITKKGLEFLAKSPQEIDLSGPCPDCGKKTLEVHDIEFKGKIAFPLEIYPSLLKLLNPKKYQERSMPSWKYYNLYFDNVTIQIFPWKYKIHIHSIRGESVEDCLELAFLEATKYIDSMDQAGIKIHNMTLVYQHLSKESGLFAHLLQKANDDYFFELSSGTKIWIDRSKNVIEDETNDPKLRQKMDQFVQDLQVSESDFADLDKLKYVVGKLVQLETMKLSILKEDISDFKPDYFS